MTTKAFIKETISSIRHCEICFQNLYNQVMTDEFYVYEKILIAYKTPVPCTKSGFNALQTTQKYEKTYF